VSAAATVDLDALDAAALRALIRSKDEQLSAHAAEIERLKLLIARLQRMQFGRKSEKLEREIRQLELQLDDLEESAAESRQRSERTLPAAKRLPRETMLAIVNSYFDGITSHDGSVVLAHPGCNRYENGTRVTGRRGGVNDDCVSGFANFNLANVAARRVGFVDEEAGVVLGMAVFIRRAGSPVPRNAFSEWFWIEDGRIRNIWTAMYYPGPERPVPNWPPFEGNFPLPPNLVVAP